MNVDELRAFLGSKCEGPWELMATAVGVSESVKRTQHGLSATEIGRTVAGDAISPAIIDCRVQALAAFDPMLLEEIMSTWLPPQELRDLSARDVESDFWVTAWCSALRFTPRFQREVTAIPSLPQPLRDECRALMNSGAVLGVSESITAASTKAASYDELRRMSRNLVADEEVTDSHVDVLIQDHQGARQLERLRILLKSDLAFSRMAARRIAELFSDMWASTNASGESGSELILTELVCQRGISDPLLPRTRSELVGRLESDGPRAWQCTAYLFAGTRWTCR